jgi:hypothetical protein
VGGLGGRDDGRIGNQREVDTGVGDQVGLELVQVDVERAIEAERRGDRGDDCDHVSIMLDSSGSIKAYPERSGG